MLWGAFYGGVVGPILGGVLFGLSTMLPPGRRSPGELLAILGYMPVLGVMWFGLPGLLVGILGAIAIKHFAATNHGTEYYFIVGLIGMVSGVIAVGVYNVLITRSTPSELIYFYAAAGIAGSATSVVFLKQLRRSSP